MCSLRQREFSKSAEGGLRRIDRLGREAKRILALARERRQGIAVVIRITKDLVAELIGDPELGATKTASDVLLSTLRASERAIEISPLISVAKAELLAAAESIRESLRFQAVEA